MGLGLRQLWGGVALILGTMLIGALIDLPLSIWRTFGIEQRFGFNRTTPRVTSRTNCWACC